MSDCEALLRACMIDPDDDAPRLVLADLFDEHGKEGHLLRERGHWLAMYHSKPHLVVVYWDLVFRSMVYLPVGVIDRHELKTECAGLGNTKNKCAFRWEPVGFGWHCLSHSGLFGRDKAEWIRDAQQKDSAERMYAKV